MPLLTGFHTKVSGIFLGAMLLVSFSYGKLDNYSQEVNDNSYMGTRAFADNYSTLTDGELIEKFKETMDRMNKLAELVDEAVVVDVTNNAILNLHNKVRQIDDTEVEQSLLTVLDTALKQLNVASTSVLSADQAGTNAAIKDMQDTLSTFVSKVNEDRGKRISQVLAEELINDANLIIDNSKKRDIQVVTLLGKDDESSPLFESLWKLMKETVDETRAIGTELRNRGIEIEPVVEPGFIGLAIKPPETIVGRYVNSEVGLQIDFPEGWSGFETKLEKMTLLISTPDVPYQINQNPYSVFMSVIIMDISEVINQQSISEQESSADVLNAACEMPLSANIVGLNSMKAIEFVLECMKLQMSLTMKVFAFVTEQKVVYVIYSANSVSSYQSHLARFEESVRTVRIENTLDLSSPEIDPLFGFTTSKQTVSVNGNTYDIKISSNSKITDFSFGEKNKEISFRVETQSGIVGATSVEVSKVLEAPYAVTMDGNVIDDFMIIEDKTTGETWVGVAYTSGIRHITITGTNVMTNIQHAGESEDTDNSTAFMLFSSMMFADDGISLSVPRISTEEQNAKIVSDISVAIKQKKKSTLFAVINSGDQPIFGVKIKSTDGKIKFVKVRGWDRDKVDQNTVLVITDDSPILPNRSLVIMLITDNPDSSFEWSVFDRHKQQISSGTLMPRSQ